MASTLVFRLVTPVASGAGRYREGAVVKFIAGVLSVIAVGVLLIAYGLLNPRVPSFDERAYASYARPMLAGDRLALPDDPYAPRYGYASEYGSVYQPRAGFVP